MLILKTLATTIYICAAFWIASRAAWAGLDSIRESGRNDVLRSYEYRAGQECLRAGGG